MNELQLPRTTGRVLHCYGMLPTPFTPGGVHVDEESLAGLALSFEEAGCHSLVLLGVIGEPATLSLSEKSQVVRVAAAGSGRPLLAGVMARRLSDLEDEAPDLVNRCEGLLSGLLVPVLSSDPARLRTCVRRVHERTGLPVMVQDLPQYSGVQIPVEHLADALEGLDFLAGIKCEAPPTFRRIAYLADRGFTGLVSGFGGLGVLDDLVSGADGLAIGVTVPGILTEAVQLWYDGDVRAAVEALRRHALRIHYETQPGQSIAIRKEHWRRMGTIACGDVRPPTLPWTPDLAAHSDLHGVGALSGWAGS